MSFTFTRCCRRQKTTVVSLSTVNNNKSIYLPADNILFVICKLGLLAVQQLAHFDHQLLVMCCKIRFLNVLNFMS